MPALAALAARGEGHWSASSWLIVRGGAGLGASANAPQLGGSHGGLRVDYAFGHGFAATGRLAAPAAGAGRELALGIAWRPGRLPVRLVAGAWGGAQRGVARLDLGPSLGLSIPLADRTVRPSLDWRQRVAGQARPGSGLALSVGSDF